MQSRAALAALLVLSALLSMSMIAWQPWHVDLFRHDNLHGFTGSISIFERNHTEFDAGESAIKQLPANAAQASVVRHSNSGRLGPATRASASHHVRKSSSAVSTAHSRPRARKFEGGEPASASLPSPPASSSEAPEHRVPIIMSRQRWSPGMAVHSGPHSLGNVTDALYALLPARDPLENMTFGRCAVVGSAGLLLLRKAGGAIDGHDAVIRFNSAGTRSMEEFVGARTTLRLVNRDHVGFCDPSSQYCLQQVTSDVMLRQYQMVKAAAPSRPIFAMEPAFTESIVTDEMLRPTLGLVGIHLALALCDQVRLFGFVRNWLGYMHFHYHDDYAPRESQQARDTAEWQLILALQKRLGGQRLQLAHPCLLGTNSPCNGCPEGATCAPGIPFPLPEPGFCYGHGNPVRTLDGIHHAAKALPFADERRSCFRSCGDDEGKAAGICPGGPTGICPEDVSGARRERWWFGGGGEGMLYLKNSTPTCAQSACFHWLTCMPTWLHPFRILISTCGIPSTYTASLRFKKGVRPIQGCDLKP
eukprot:jgi/Mesvir1/5306/Mv15403-RA.3